MTIAHLDDYRPDPDLGTQQRAAIERLQECIDAIASHQVEPTAMVIGLARADAEPIILTSTPTALGAFDEIIHAATTVSGAVHASACSPSQDELMALIRTSWLNRPDG